MCMLKAHVELLERREWTSFDFVCDITVLGSDSWVLLRKIVYSDPACAGRRVMLFASQHKLTPLSAVGRMESISLETRTCGNGAILQSEQSPQAT